MLHNSDVAMTTDGNTWRIKCGLLWGSAPAIVGTIFLYHPMHGIVLAKASQVKTVHSWGTVSRRNPTLATELSGNDPRGRKAKECMEDGFNRAMDTLDVSKFQVLSLTAAPPWVDAAPSSSA